MISVTDLRAGTTFEENGQLYQVLTYQHIKMGRGSANVRVKIRNLKTGTVLEKGFMSSAKVNDVVLEKKQLQFLYQDENSAYFMDPASFEQLAVSLNVIPGHQLLKEGETFSLSFYNEQALALNLPAKMEFKVIEAGPAVRGNSVANIYKDAMLENGIKTRVPLFIKNGDLISINTQTLEYDEKKNK